MGLRRFAQMIADNADKIFSSAKSIAICIICVNPSITYLKKMKKTFPLFLCLFAAKVAFSQLIVSPTNVDFGVVAENAPDSVELTIKNPYNYDIQVSDILTIDDNYGNMPFSVSQNNFLVLAGDSAKVWLKCKPTHNIFHESEIVVVDNSFKGSTRVDVKAQGHYSNTYYTSTENLSNQALKTALTTRLAQGYTSLGYTPARDQMYMQIDNQKVNGQGATVNTIESVYTGQQVTGYTSRVDAQNQGFNTEHTYPQSFFSSNEPMVSDLFHIFPTDNTSNSERGNNPFAMVASPNWSVGGSKSNGSTFEPRDAQKGRTARAMLYFVLRYEDYSCFEKNQETILKQWHTQFLPTQEEKNRNNAIYAVQHNRNPFIDYPQFVQRMNYVTSCSTAVGTAISSILIPENAINYGDIGINSAHLYSFTIVNDGNQPLDISSIGSVSPNISFVNGANTTIAAGEAMVLQVSLTLNSLGAFSSTLQFNTNITTQPTITIPVTANGIDAVGIEESNTKNVVIYPNPAQAILFVEHTGKAVDIEIVDVFGKLLFTGEVNKSLEINLSKYAAGVYFLQTSEGEVLKFVKE